MSQCDNTKQNKQHRACWQSGWCAAGLEGSGCLIYSIGTQVFPVSPDKSFTTTKGKKRVKKGLKTRERGHHNYLFTHKLCCQENTFGMKSDLTDVLLKEWSKNSHNQSLWKAVPEESKPLWLHKVGCHHTFRFTSMSFLSF